jgi:hypothetical protein
VGSVCCAGQPETENEKIHFIFILFFENINIYLYILTQDTFHAFFPSLPLKAWSIYHNRNIYVQIAFTFTYTTFILYTI